MRTLLIDPPAPVRDWLEQRRALGQDLYDEVWEGTYIVAPARHPSHGYLDREVAVLLAPLAAAAGLHGAGPLNLGEPGDYRVPDGVYTRERARTTFVETVAIVVEIVSPDDQTWQKLGFYHAHGVEEILVVDPRSRQLTWLTRGTEEFEQADGSTLLGISAADLADQISWPPLD